MDLLTICTRVACVNSQVVFFVYFSTMVISLFDLFFEY